MLNRAFRSVAGVVLLAASLLLPPALAMPPEAGPAPDQDAAPRPDLPVQEPGPRVEPGARERIDLRDVLREAEPAEAAEILRAFAREKGIPLDERPPMPYDPEWSIVLSTVTLTPTPGVEPSLEAKLQALPDAEAEIPVLLQFNRRLSLGETIELYELGLKGLATERRNYARIVLARAESLPALLEKSYVRWVGEYKEEYKYSPEPSGSGRKTAFIYPIDKARERYKADLTRMGIQVTHTDDIVGLYSVVLEEERFPEAAELPWIRWIHKAPEEEPEGWQDYEPDDSRELVCAFKGFRTGSGVTVGIRDDGIYAVHPDLAGIFVTGSESSPVKEHGTHVTGILAGRGTRNLRGEHDATGIAPGAQVLFRTYDSDVTDDVTNYSQDFAVFDSNSVQISNHSYWFHNQDYDADTRNYDEYVDNDDMIIVKSAGNQGPGANTITNPGTGKNVIAVGAVLYVDDDSKGKEVGDIAVYSSRGPTLDNGRLKPELVAPGGQTVHDYNDYRHGVVSCNEDPNGTSTDDEWPEDDAYTRSSGTSMAAPHVAGALALMKESYASLSSEAAKARLIGGTIPLKNSSGSDPLNGYANTEAGYGLLNAYQAAGHGCSEAYTLAWEEGVVDYADDSDEYAFTVPSGTEQLIAVMAYNDDAPDDTGQIQDDVDLWLEDDLGATYPYVLPTGVTALGTVEKVIVESPRSGVQWTAHVVLDNPSFSDSQDYGLYILAILDLPELGLSASLPHGGYYAPGEAFTLSTTAENTGDWIVAGVTGRVMGDIGGEWDKVKFYDSLVCNGDSKTVTFDLEAPADWGPHSFTVTAKGVNRGLADDSAPLTIVVCDTYNRPDLVQPANGSTTCDATPTFDWDPLAGAASYRLQVDDDGDFGSTAIDVSTTGTQYTPSSSLSAGFYLWRVRGEAPSCQGLWSAVRSFTVKTAPTAPDLYYPGNGGEICGTSPYFSWYGVSEATQYQIQVDNNSGFGSPEIDETTANTSYTYGSSLPLGTYSWRVRAQNTCGWGAWSSAWSFASTATTPSPPSLVSPGYGEDTCDRTPTLVWSEAPEAASYHIQVDNDSDFNSPEMDYGIYGTEYTPSSALPLDRHYWRVRSYNSCGYGAWSETGRVDVVGVPPVPTHITPADGSEQCNANLGFDWSSQWAMSYRLWVDNHPSFSSPEIAVATSNSWYSGGESLSPGHYYWRVWAENECGASGWSSPWSFTAVEMPGHPVLSQPVDTVLCDTTPTFWWSDSTWWGDTLFRIQVDDDSSFNSPNRDATSPDSSYTLSEPLASPKEWWWRVNAQNACGASVWSQQERFRLTTVAPSTPSLVTPGDGSETCDPTPRFEWTLLTYASSYEVQVDDDPGFGSPEIEATMPMFVWNYTPESPLPPGDYHWRVRACNDCGCGEWSAAWDVTIQSTPEAPRLRGPDEGTTTYDNTPTFQWFSVNGANAYRFELDDEPDFGSPDVVQITYEPDRSYQAGTMADGVYFWRVQASNTCGSGPRSEGRELTIDTVCQTPPPVDKTAPPNGSQTCDATPTFEWTAKSGATSYRIQLDNNGSSYDFGSPVIDTTTTGASYTPETALAGDIYYWRVRPCNACGCNNWSSAWDVEVGPPWAPTLDRPADWSIFCEPYSGSLSWDSLPTATSYEVQVDNGASFDSPLIHEPTPQRSYWPDSPWPAGTWYWRARGCNDCGCGAWSEAWMFTVGPPDSAPALTWPADGRGVCTATPTFAWSAVSGTQSYELEVDTDPGFPSPGIDATTPETEYTPASPLPFGTLYWRVQASNACGSSGWSGTWTLVCADCLQRYVPVVYREWP